MALSNSINAVDPRPVVRRLSVNSSGLSTSGGNYSPNNQLGGEFVFANATRFAGNFSTITTATFLDRANTVGAIDLHLFSQSITPASDKTSANFSDSDMQYYVGTLSFPSPTPLVNNRATSLPAIGLTFQTTATSLFGYAVTLTQHSPFNAVNDINISLIVYQY